jgi:hypothetical protein
MTWKGHESLKDLLVDIELLDKLPGNPRRGAVGAIKASYERFGQQKPIIGHIGDNDRITIIAGNHQLEAMKELGWTQAAVLARRWEPGEAEAFAVADNRVAELGSTDEDALFEMLQEISQGEEELLTGLEWDPFELALLEESYDRSNFDEGEDLSGGYVPPVIIDQPSTTTSPSTPREDEGEIEYHADEETTEDIVTMGATAVDKAGAKTTYQYTLLFEGVEQQKEWYDFLRFLKGLKEYEDLTTSEQVLAFIRDNHES